MAQYVQLSASAQIKRAAGKIYGVLISTTSSGTITIYDTPDSDTNDPKILNTFTPTAGQTISFLPGTLFSNGLYVAVANTLTFTVIYE